MPPHPTCLTWDMICFQDKRVPLQEKLVPLQEKRVRFLVEEQTRFLVEEQTRFLVEERKRFSTKNLYRDSVGKYYVKTDYLPNYRIYDIQELEELNNFFSKVYNQKKSTSGIYQHMR
jgi:hypothetical protein